MNVFPPCACVSSFVSKGEEQHKQLEKRNEREWKDEEEAGS